MTNKNRNLAKGMLPALLLSAALAVPATSFAAPGKGHPAQKHEEKAQKHAQKAQKEARKAQQQANKARTQRPARVVVVQPQPKRVVVVQQPQRVVVPQRRVVVAPAPVYVARRPVARGRAWDGWNQRYNRQGSNVFQLDGTFYDQQAGCALVRDHSGQVIPLVGNPGELRRGDHLLLTGRIQSGTVCGTAFRVDRVERAWADPAHRRVLFDSRRDGDWYGYRNGQDRYDDRYDRDDRYGRNDRDGRRDGRDDRYDDRAISIEGRLDDSGDCPVIRGDRGEYYDLVGDLRNFRDGARARVVGVPGIRSECGGKALEVAQIVR